MSITIDPYLVARDAIRGMTDLGQFNQLSEELRLRRNELAAAGRFTLRPGDTVLYVGTSRVYGLVPHFTKGTVVRPMRSNLLVRFDIPGRPMDLRCPPSLIQKITEEIELPPPGPERVADIELHAEPSEDDLSWMLEGVG